MADLVDLAFREFPSYGPRCGHRLVPRSIPGFPPIQFCIWGVLGIDERVVLVVLPDQGGVLTVRAPKASSPIQLLQQAGREDLSEAISDRRLHITASGRPCQPTDAFVVQAHEVFRVVRGPPPVRAQSTYLRRWALPPPQSLPCLGTRQISDAEADGTICIHQVGASHFVLPIPHTLRAIQASAFAAAVAGGSPHALLRFPLASPLVAGTMPHAVLATRPNVAGQGYAIVDMQRVLRPPIAPFITVPVPSIITQPLVIEQLGSIAAHMRAAASFYVDGELLGSGISIVSMACTITLFGYNAFPSSDNVFPAVLDTMDALSDRGGFRSFFSRPRCTSTSTTTTFVPGATEAACSSNQPEDRAPRRATGSAINPELLDFLRDEAALTRISVDERLNAYTLFDSVLQTRLAPKGAHWNYVDCLADARQHFTHLGPEPELRFLRDTVDGLPVPQIVATPSAVSHRVSAFPVDARPAGRGICILDVPHTATPFSVAYQAAGACQMTGLHQQIARRNCVMRGRGQDLPPHDAMTHIDSATVWFVEDLPRLSLASQFHIQESALEALREARDLQHSFFEHEEPVPVMLHVPDIPPLQMFVPKECSAELLHSLAIETLGTPKPSLAFARRLSKGD